MKVLVLHGPNVNLLGEREGDNPEWSLETVNHIIEDEAASLGLEVKIVQSNHEGALIDTLHESRRWAEAVVINPSALAHTSYVLRDAIAAVGKPTIEVHMSDIRRREPWRRRAVLRDVCVARVIGKGVDSYLIALRSLAGSKPAAHRSVKRQPAVGKGRETKPAPGETERTRSSKTIGRRAAVPAEGAGSAPASAESRNGFLRDRAGAPPGASAKSIGQTSLAAKRSASREFLTRALVRQKIADRLAGKLTPSGLATWARQHWLEVQRGAPAESGYRELLEDCLQSLVLSALPASKLSEDQLLDLMTQLE
jgi:3-dehydroquinate dehydratase-2